MAVLLFDLDGTLADTNPDLHAAMNHILGARVDAIAAGQGAPFDWRRRGNDFATRFAEHG